VPFANKVLWKKVALAVSILAYAALFLYLNTFFSRQVAVVAVLPVMMAGVLYGMWAGIAAGLLSFPANVVLYALSEQHGLLAEFSAYGGGRVLGQCSVILIGGVIGRMHDLAQTARCALRQRAEAENMLARLNADLEGLVRIRTEELLESNQSLRLEVAERQKAEDDARQARESLENIFAAVVDGLIVTDANGYVLRINRKMEDITGYTQSEVLGKHVSELGAREQPYIDIATEMMAKLHVQGFVENYETAWIRKDGRLVPVEFNLTFLKDQDGHITGAAGAVRDISLRTQVEARLKESEERYRSFVAAARDAIITIDGQGVIVFWNPAAEALFGYATGEAIGKPLDFILPGYARNYAQHWAQRCCEAAAAQNPLDTLEVSGVRKDGTAVPLECSVSSWQVGQDCFSTAIMRDITTRKKAEQQIKESRDFLENIFRTSVDGILISLKNRVITMANDAAGKILGCSKEELVGKDFIAFNLTGEQHEADALRFITKLLDEGSVSCHEMPLLRQDGQIITVELSAALLRGDQGALTGSVVVLRDVSERRRAQEERERMELQLRQSQKLEAIGTLAGGIAHDFNNILAAIIGYAEIVRDDIPAGQARRNLEQVLKAADRAKKLVNQILAFSRKGDLEQGPVQLHLVVLEALKLLRASLPTTIEIRERITKQNDTILADPTRMHQVVMNLGTNAAHAMPEGGMLEIALDTLELCADDARLYAGLTPGPHVRLTVRDTGTGIARDIFDRIFDPFFTTKQPGQGTGMGLSVVDSIIKSHGGAIKVYSEPGRGTIFHVLLPCTQEGCAVDPAAAKMPPRGRESILLVDDEEMLLDIGRSMLASLGYRVAVQQSSREALALFQKDPLRFDLVITDQTMPHMTGDRLAQEMLAIRPGMPIILCTGYSERVSEESARDLGIRAFVMKPFNRTAIAEAIRSALDGGAA